MYPLALFYESDSRENLEENLKNNFIENGISNSSPNTVYFLGEDHMFVQACLDGLGVLGLLPDTGWNLYCECPKEQKEVAETGLRTDFIQLIDHVHPEFLFRSIAIQHVVPCILRWITRCGEKLFTRWRWRMLSLLPINENRGVVSCNWMI